MDLAKGEATEKELDGLIRRRHDDRVAENGHRPSEDLWAESVRRHHARQQQELAWEWLRYHVARQRAHRHTFALLDAHHSAEIEKYERMLNIDYQGGDAA